MMRPITASQCWILMVCFLSPLSSNGYVGQLRAQQVSDNQVIRGTVVPQGWHVSTTDLGKIQMAFPGEVNIIKHKLGDFPVEVHQFMGEKIGFVVQVMDISSDRRSSRSIESLKGLAGNFAQQGFDTIGMKELQWLDRTVVEVSLRASDRSVNSAGVIRTFFIDDLVVLISCVGRFDAETLEKQTGTFFSSFVLSGGKIANDLKLANAEKIRLLITNQSAAKRASRPDRKLSKEVIHSLLEADSDIDFLLSLEEVDCENLDQATISFAIDLWLTAQDMTQLVMLSNAYSDASMSALRLHEAVTHHSVDSWLRRRLIRAFLAKYYSDQIYDVRRAKGFEIRAKQIVLKLGVAAAPTLASRGKAELIEEIGDSSVATLRRSAEDKKNPHRLASYFALRTVFSGAEVTPLPIAELLEIARVESNPYRSQAINEIERLGHSGKLIDQYVRKRFKQEPRKYESGFVEQCQKEIEESDERHRRLHQEGEMIDAGVAMSEKGDRHHSLVNFYLDRKDRVGAKREFELAKDAFERAELLFQGEIKDKREAERRRIFRAINLKRTGELFQSGRLHARAIEKFNEALAVNPHCVDSAEGIANSLMDLENYRAAAEQYQRAIDVEHDRFDPKVHIREYRNRNIVRMYCKMLDANRKIGDAEEIKRVESRILWYLKDI